jgi:putative transcriptional regulator
MNLQNQLKEVRLQRELTQEKLAEMVGVTRQTIIAIEKAKFIPSVKLALELSHALDEPFGQVFWLEENQGEKDE